MTAEGAQSFVGHGRVGFPSFCRLLGQASPRLRLEEKGSLILRLRDAPRRRQQRRRRAPRPSTSSVASDATAARSIDLISQERAETVTPHYRVVVSRGGGRVLQQLRSVLWVSVMCVFSSHVHHGLGVILGRFVFAFLPTCACCSSRRRHLPSCANTSGRELFYNTRDRVRLPSARGATGSLFSNAVVLGLCGVVFKSLLDKTCVVKRSLQVIVGSS